MSNKSQNVIKWSVAVLLLLVVMSGMTGSVFAQEAFHGNSVAPDETVENDIILNGDNVDLDGEVNGDVLALGRHVTIDGVITGSLVAIAETITINGEVQGSIYALAVNLVLTPTANVGHNVHFVGVSIVMEQGAVIGRDLAVVSLGARIRGTIGRDSRLIVGAVEIVRLILDQINRSATGKSIEEVGLFREPARASAMVPTGALFRLLSQEEETDVETDAETPPILQTLWDSLRGFAGYMIIGLLLIWLMPARLDGWAEHLRMRPLLAFGIGVVIFIVGFVGFILLMVLGVGLSIAFFSLTLQNLGFIMLALSIAGLGLALTFFMIFVTFISKVVVAYLVGRLILGRFLQRALRFRIWPLLLGVTLYVLICAIPVVGWVVSLIITFLGLGGVWLAFSDREARQAMVGAPASAGGK